MTSLPSIGPLTINQDPNRQLSQMRSYLMQLKDELEAELMNIGYDNLSGDLKKRFESISDDIIAAGSSTEELREYISANVVTTDYLEANYVTAAYLQANYVSTDYLEANYITASDIAASYVTTSVLEANYITASAIAAKYVTTSVLEANYITATAIEAEYIKASIVTASYIAGKFTASNQAEFQWIKAKDLKVANGITMDDEGQTKVFTPITMNGYRVLAAPISQRSA